MMQRLRSEKMIAGSERQIEFLDPRAIRTLAQYQPQARTDSAANVGLSLLVRCPQSTGRWQHRGYDNGPAG